MARYEQLMRDIDNGATIVLDGATGTELARRGAPTDGLAWCAPATATHADTLFDIHLDYIKAGARIITANTFASTRETLASAGLAEQFEVLNRRAVEIAIAARDAAPDPDRVLVAGSITHLRPGGVEVWGGEFPSTPDEFAANVRAMAGIHRDAGCDLILAEMMGDATYAPILIRTVQSVGLPLWVGLSTIEGADGELRTFAAGMPLFRDVIAPIVAAGGDVFGVMHSKSARTSEALRLLREHWHGPLMAYPDSVVYRTSPEQKVTGDGETDEAAFADYCAQWIDEGVQVLGGCCGFTVSHIAALSEQVAAR